MSKWLRKMTDTVTNPSTMDKAVLVVAAVGVIIAAVTVRNVPTPDEHYASVRGVLDSMLLLQNKTNNAISKGDYYTACLNQQKVVDLALQHNISDMGIDVDNLLKLEESLCSPENKELF